MITMLQSLAQVIPGTVRAKLKRLHRDWVFSLALRRWAALGADSEPPQWLLQRLIYGWGNERFAARADTPSQAPRAKLLAHGMRWPPWRHPRRQIRAASRDEEVLIAGVRYPAG
jgi:hypothetical protein